MVHRLSTWVLSFACLCCSWQAIGQSFNISQLSGETVQNPTDIAFGPDDKLYILDVYGSIHIYTITRTAPNAYQVTSTQIIGLVRSIQNHNDNGQVHTQQVPLRQATGMVVTGTSTNPVIFVTSSDYRMGGGDFENQIDLNLDTNSGIISKLTKNGAVWSKVDLVRGLPRSEENHATNGLFLDEENNILYVAQGGNTNGGAPSTALALLCETALSAAILSVDLNVIDTMPVLTDTSDGSAYVYDLPTLDDPTRDNANGINEPMDQDYDGIDLHDPFGGNDALNQAVLVEDGPVQIYASGMRNSYDVMISDLGIMYTWDNGPNPGFGGYPKFEGYGTATNEYVLGEPGSFGMSNNDCLHRIIGPGYYGGHPNPTRGNPDSAGLYTFGTNGVYRTEYLPGNPDSSLPYDWPPIPTGMANPIEGDYQSQGIANTFMYSIFKKSMNGMCEYKATHFDSAMTGDILATALLPYQNSSLYRVNLNDTGAIDSPSDVTVLASGMPAGAITVCALGDEPPFPGTIWIGNHIGGGPIFVLEPADFFPCTGVDSYNIDEDSDGFTNADEYDNGTNPCNGADRPSDFDGTLIGGFLVSNLNDPDDDDDGLNDTIDYFVLDSLNGLGTTIPIEYPLLISDPGFGFYGLGFTGLMMNSEDDYLDLWKNSGNSTTQIIGGAAAGLLSFIGVSQGDALNAFNDQHNAFQFGIAVDSTTAPFIAEAQLLGPLFPDTIQDFQSMGMFIGTGNQDNYVKIVVNANGGMPGIAVITETNGVSTTSQYPISSIGTENFVRLALIINPENGFARAQYAVGMNSLGDLGDGFYVQGPLLDSLRGPQAIAFGVISTARGSENRFDATWAHLSVRYDPRTSGHWLTLQDATDCEPVGTPGSCCQSRHEAAFVQSGDKFYLLGGRENNSNVNIYNPLTDTWTVGTNPPGNSLHHFQAFDYHGLIVSAGAFSGGFPEESPVPQLRVYNPLTNTWHNGPFIPVDSRRGSAGSVIRNDTLYLVGGATNGHIGGSVNWLDSYSFKSDTWESLPNAPNQRDHFHAVVKDQKIYASAGRRTTIGNVWLDTESTVDVYDLATQSWDTVIAPIPTKRAGNSVAVLGDELFIIGGERESGPAKNATEALNLTTETWRTVDSLNLGRHGSQAIVNNQGIYIASGATTQGGNTTTRTTEAFYLFGETDPILTPTIASELAADNVDFDTVAISQTATIDVFVYNTNGNQAILLHNMTMFDSTAFVVDTMLTFPRFLKPGDSLRIPLAFEPTFVQNYSDTLYFQHTGSNSPVKKIVLNGEGIFNWFGSTRAYVDSSATGIRLGNSWANAFTSVTEALDVAMEFPQITEVWIAKGTYTPLNTRTSSFVLRDSLEIFGGFHGTEILLSQRDIEDFPVVFSGDIGVTGDSTDNTFHVVIMMENDQAALLDGITIEGGFANGGVDYDRRAAGILNFGKLNLTNVTIRHCTSINAGSALVNSGSEAVMILENVLLQNNSDPHLVNEGNAVFTLKGVSNLIEGD